MDLGARTTDPVEAKRIWRRFSEVLQADQPFTFLYWQDELAAVNRSLEGVVMDARGELVSLPRWRWTADRAEIERGD
jgi:ABC-type transport system substrate-binding protein